VALTFEWDKDIYGRDILLVRKKRGKITIAELQEELSRDWRYCGGWVLIVRAREDAYVGWGDNEDPKGDVLELHQIEDGAACPLCAAVYSGVEDHCPHCGKRIKATESGG